MGHEEEIIIFKYTPIILHDKGLLSREKDFPRTCFIRGQGAPTIPFSGLPVSQKGQNYSQQRPEFKEISWEHFSQETEEEMGKKKFCQQRNTWKVMAQRHSQIKDRFNHKFLEAFFPLRIFITPVRI